MIIQLIVITDYTTLHVYINLKSISHYVELNFYIVTKSFNFVLNQVQINNKEMKNQNFFNSYWTAEFMCTTSVFIFLKYLVTLTLLLNNI